MQWVGFASGLREGADRLILQGGHDPAGSEHARPGVAALGPGRPRAADRGHDGRRRPGRLVVGKPQPPQSAEGGGHLATIHGPLRVADVLSISFFPEDNARQGFFERADLRPPPAPVLTQLGGSVRDQRTTTSKPGIFPKLRRSRVATR